MVLASYPAWIVSKMSNETAMSSPLSANKHSFAEYFKFFPEGREALVLKKEKAKEKTASSTSSSTTRQTSSRTSGATDVALLVGGSLLSPQEIAKRNRSFVLLQWSITPTGFHYQHLFNKTLILNPVPPSLPNLLIKLLTDASQTFFKKHSLYQRNGSKIFNSWETNCKSKIVDLVT